MTEQQEAVVMQAFERWWHEEGSQAPKPGFDFEEHCYQIAKIAWSNGAYKALEQQPADEPVAWMGTDIEGTPNKFRLNPFGGSVPLYEHPTTPVKIWDAVGYDSLMQQLEMWKAKAQQPAGEPVAVVGSGFQLLWTGGASFAEHAQKHGIKVGSSLYTRPQPVAPAMFGGGLVAIKTLLSRDPCAHAKVAIEMIDAMLAAAPEQKGN